MSEEPVSTWRLKVWPPTVTGTVYALCAWNRHSFR